MFFNKTSYLNVDDNPSKDAKSRARFSMRFDAHYIVF
jgi:hypothetical protein